MAFFFIEVRCGKGLCGLEVLMLLSCAPMFLILHF